MKKKRNEVSNSMKNRQITDDFAQRQELLEEINPDNREIRVVFATDEPQEMTMVRNGRTIRYYERLIISPNAMRTDRLNKNAPFVKDHRVFDVDAVIGTVIPDSLEMSAGRASVRIRLSDAPNAFSTVTKILEGVLPGVSVGYRQHRQELTEEVIDGLPVYNTTDYTPFEITTTAFPLDLDSEVTERSEDELHQCVVIEGEKKYETDLPVVSRSISQVMENKIMTKKTKDAVDTDVVDNADEAKRSGTADSVHRVEVEVSTKEAEAKRSLNVDSIEEVEKVDVDSIRSSAVEEYKKRSADIETIASKMKFDADWVAAKRDSDLSIDAIRAEAIEEFASRDALSDSDQGSRATSTKAFAAPVADDSDFVKAAADHLVKREAPAKFADMETDASFGNAGMFSIAEQTVRRSGVDTFGMSREAVIRTALGSDKTRGGAHTLSDFPDIIGLANNTLIQAGYNEPSVAYPSISSPINLGDFDETTMLRIGNAPDLLDVIPGEDYEAGTFGTGTEKIKLKTVARSIVVTRQLLVSDQAGALARVALGWGRKARLRIEADAIGFLFANANLSDGRALFHSRRGNIFTTGSAISNDSLDEVRTMFAKFKDTDGTPISIDPSILLVGDGARWSEAMKLLGEYAPTTAAEVSNHRGQYTVVTSKVITNHASQSGAWFAMASPSDFGDGLRIGYLGGNQAPQVDTNVNTRNATIENNVYLDFAVGVGDPLFGVYNSGS